MYSSVVKATLFLWATELYWSDWDFYSLLGPTKHCPCTFGNCHKLEKTTSSPCFKGRIQSWLHLAGYYSVLLKGGRTKLDLIKEVRT